jgi:hypothetical protein
VSTVEVLKRRRHDATRETVGSPLGSGNPSFSSIFSIFSIVSMLYSFQIVKLCFLKNTSGSKPGDWCCHSISRACKAGMEACYLSRRRTSGALPISWRRANLGAALKVSSDNKANWTL